MTAAVNTPEAAYRYVEAFAGALAAAGVRHVCLAPGSRSTPLALMLAGEPMLRLWPHVDERSMAFFALGMARAHGQPVALVSTSGTAAANFYPAVIEARYGRVPLVVLTADRPHELRDVGAPQSIDQLRLYGPHVKWFMDMALPEATPALERYARWAAARAVAEATAPPAGPVHLNFPFREPLVPRPPATGSGEAPPAGTGAPRPDPASVRRGHLRLEPDEVAALAREMAGARRGILVCGPQPDPALAPAAARLASAMEWPILADPLSGVRCGPHLRPAVIDSYDALLRLPEVARAVRPQLVLRVGGWPVSKALQQFLEEQPGAAHFLIDDGSGWQDPSRLAGQVIHAQPAWLLDRLAAHLEAAGRHAPPAQEPGGGTRPWLAFWHALDTAARQAIRHALDAMDVPFEGRVFAELVNLLPAGATLFVGNSMPVRDLDTFLPTCGRPLRILANRGASGIDGVVSSALGAAALAPGPTVLVIGDLSFYHDLNGLLAARLHGLALTVVLVHNDGGGIFSFLPQAEHPEHFERLFATPTGLDFRPAVAMYGGRFIAPAGWEHFRQAVRDGLEGGGLTVVEVRTDRRRNVADHRAVWRAVAAAVQPLLPGPGGQLG